MSWAEIKKSVNSNLEVPLNELIDDYNTYEMPDGTTAKIVGQDIHMSNDVLPYMSKESVVVSYKGEIHLIGGLNDSDSTVEERLLHYKWNGTSWVSVSTLPGGYNGCLGVVYNDEIYLLGGNASAHYKWDGTSWASVFANLPYSFGYGGLVVYNDEIHIMGGNGTSNNNRHYKWNGTSWVIVSTLPYAAFHCKVVVYNNEIHLLGGHSSDTKSQNVSYNHYKWDGTSWTKLNDLPMAFGAGGLIAVYKNAIYIACSEYDSNYTIFRNKCYKWDGEIWQAVSELPQDFYFGSFVVHNDELHILGGTDNTGLKHYVLTDKTEEEESGFPSRYITQLSDRCCAASVVYNDYIYMIACNNNGTCYRYDGVKPPEQIANLPIYDTSSSAITAMIYNNEIHVIGANTGHYIYRNGEWVVGSSLPVPSDSSFPTFYGLKTVVYDNKIYMLKQYNDKYNYPKWFLYTFDGYTWSEPYESRYQMGWTTECCMVVYNNEIHLLGGCVKASEDRGNKHYKWDGTSWVRLPNDLPYLTAQACVVVYHDELHLIGGGSYGTAYANAHYTYDGESWTERKGLPIRVSGATAVVYNDQIHILSPDSSVVGSGLDYVLPATLQKAEPQQIIDGISKVFETEDGMRYRYDIEGV